MSQPVNPVTGEKKGPPDKYEIESAADTLLRAEQIKADKKLMPHVHKHLQEKKKAVIRSLEDLKKVSHDRRMEIIEEDMEAEQKKIKVMADPSPDQLPRLADKIDTDNPTKAEKIKAES